MISNKLNKLKINKTSKNHKTKKNKNNSDDFKNLTSNQISNICDKNKNTFDTFEDKADELFKKNKINIVSTSSNLEKQVVSNIKKAINPKMIKPNEDFYSYINDRWIDDYELTQSQKYIIQIDDFRLTQDKVYRELIELIKNYISDPNTKNSKKAECIKNAYLSFLTFNTTEQTRCLSNIALEYLDNELKDKNNIWKRLGILNRDELTSWGSPFVWSLNPDEKNPTIYRCYLEPPQLTLIDTDVYFDDESDSEKEKNYKHNYRKRYFKYLNDVFTVAYGENHGFNVKDIFDTEFEILNAMACDLIKDSDDDNYNLVSKEEALKNFGFNWEEFCKNMGFQKIPSDFVTSNINYLLCGTKLLLEKWNSPQWRTFWIYLYIRQQTRWDEKGFKVFFDFQGTFVRGQEGAVESDIRPVFGMGFCFNTFLTNEYIEHYKNEKLINYVKSLASDLKTVFIRIIKRNNWMQEKTKKKALKKLENLKLTVGSPEMLREDPLLDYKSDDPWGNLIKKASWRHSEAIQLVGKKVIDIPIVDWAQIPPKFVGTQSYVVNASYTPTTNGIYIPLGYIQPPFVDLNERGLEYNLSRIGFTIAHEMSHALDDWGSKYDEFGKLNNWWTEKDRKEFKKIQKDVIKQYEVFASYDGIKFDAAPSIGEDLADISGLAICQEYLRDFQMKNNDVLPIQSLSFEAFFIFFTTQSRQKISKKAIIAQLKTNPHPLDKYRCNVPLSRTKVFRAIYNVEKGDKMWWHSTSSIWN